MRNLIDFKNLFTPIVVILGSIMDECLRGVVLRTYKYNDKNSVVRVYTDSRGLLSFLLPESASRSARMRRAVFQPLSLVEIDASILPRRDIHRIRHASIVVATPSLHTNPTKCAIALFITELLSHIIIEQEQDAPLYAFLARSVMLLDNIDSGVANFHICFLYNLGSFIGIEPDMDTYVEGSYFDLQNGVFLRMRPLHNDFLEQEESAVLARLSRINYSNMHLYRFNREQRRLLLAEMLRYYKLHNSSLGDVKSLDTLHELFS